MQDTLCYTDGRNKIGRQESDQCDEMAEMLFLYIHDARIETVPHGQSYGAGNTSWHDWA
jgi:hypothetical protein